MQWQVRLYDEDLLASDDDLGTAMLPMASLQKGEPQELTLDLKGEPVTACPGAMLDLFKLML